MTVTPNAMQLEIPAFGNYYYQQGATLDSYITDTLAPLLYYKFDETSGNLINHGSESGADGVVNGATQAQTGQLGAGEAYSFDGVNDVVTVANANIPNVVALTSQRFAFLCNPLTVGEGTLGVFFAFGDLGAGDNFLRFIPTNRLQCVIRRASTDASLATTNEDIADLLGNWCWVFGDHATTATIRLWKGINGTLTALGTASAGSGAITTMVNDLNVGNNSALSNTFNGLFDVYIHDSGQWTTEEMQQLIDLSGV